MVDNVESDPEPVPAATEPDQASAEDDAEDPTALVETGPTPDAEDAIAEGVEEPAQDVAAETDVAAPEETGPPQMPRVM